MPDLLKHYDAELVSAATRLPGVDKHDLNNFLAVYQACTGQYGRIVPYACEENAVACHELLRLWVQGKVLSLQKAVASQIKKSKSHG